MRTIVWFPGIVLALCFVSPALAQTTEVYAWGVSLAPGCNEYSAGAGCDYDHGSVFVYNVGETWVRVEIEDGLFTSDGPTKCGVHPALGDCPCDCNICGDPPCRIELRPNRSWRSGCKVACGYEDCGVSCPCGRRLCYLGPNHGQRCESDNDCLPGTCAQGTIALNGCWNESPDCNLTGCQVNAFCGSVSANVRITATSVDGRNWIPAKQTVALTSVDNCGADCSCQPNPNDSCRYCTWLPPTP